MDDSFLFKIREKYMFFYVNLKISIYFFVIFEKVYGYNSTSTSLYFYLAYNYCTPNIPRGRQSQSEVRENVFSFFQISHEVP